MATAIVASSSEEDEPVGTTPTTTKYWWANKESEEKRTAAAESDWKLPGVGTPPKSRTRNNGDRSSSTTRGAAISGRALSYAESSSYSSSSDELDDDELEPKDFVKPSSTRAIFEVNPLMDFIERNANCRECKGPIKADIKTVCVASTPRLFCLNDKCGFVDNCSNGAAAASVPAVANQGSALIERTTDYAINILYVLGFMWCGDGGTEAARILGLLGLPNDTTMETRSFSLIEHRIGPVIRRLTEAIVLENLTEEVRLTMEASVDLDDNDFLLWKQASVNDPTFVLAAAKYPALTVSVDMGWQQRGGGWNSNSGHAFLVGACTRKAIAMCVKSKLCSRCTALKKNGDVEPVDKRHQCRRNHDGTSTAMEPQACLGMVIDLFDKSHCSVKRIVADDDASTRSMVTWCNADYLANNDTDILPQVPITRGPRKGQLQDRPEKYGRLPGYIPEPNFVADPNHRKKLLTGELNVLAKSTGVDKDTGLGNKMTMTKMDSLRLGKNYGYMSRALHRTPEAGHLEAGKAVLEHHFDNHSHCGDWCRRKDMTKEELDVSTRFYRSKAKDARLYAKLQEIVKRFITKEALKDLNHSTDTNCNESLNNTISWLAPKNKMYCTTWSLSNRVSMAIGINSIGISEFFRRLFSKLGIAMTRDVRHFLHAKETVRSNRLASLRTPTQKKIRIQHKMRALEEHTATAKRERARREGTYQSGRNFAKGSSAGFTEEELEEARTKKRRKRDPDATCKHCGGKGHSRKTHRDCSHYKARRKNAATITLEESIRIDADEAEHLDSLPLDADPPSDDELAFVDAGTWSEDEEGQIIGII